MICLDAAQSIKSAILLGLSSLRAEVPQQLGDWARDNFKLAGESSHQKGPWVAWAFQIGMLDFMSDDRIEELDVIKAKRVGYTKMVTAYIAYNIAHRRRKQALWQPTDDDRDSYVKSEIDPMLDPVDGVLAINAARKKAGAGRKIHDETIKYKSFRDSALHLLGGKASRAYRRITVAVAILDEISKFDRSIENSGPPRGLARGRMEGAAHPKLVCGSTPLLKGRCHIEDAASEADGLVRYHIECRHCGLDHPLIWGGKDKLHGFKWEAGNPGTVRHVCPHCHESITQADYLPSSAPMGGTWVCERTGKRYGADRIWRDNTGAPCLPPRHLAVHVWTAYSPQRSWPDVVKEFESAQHALERGENGPMMLFTNETLGETWEVVGDRADEHAIQSRAEPYSLGTVPQGGLSLTAGIDLQNNRWEISVWAWGRGMESWCVDHQVIFGNAASDEDWESVAIALQQKYLLPNGDMIGISATSIDSSDQSHAVYNWVSKAQLYLPQLRAIKGSSQGGGPILGASSLKDVDWRGNKRRHGIRLWIVGVDTAKDLLHGQLSITHHGPGYIHTSQDLPTEWYEQLTAEKRILVRNGGRDAYRWVPRRKRNEVLDCRNYALHAALGLGLHKYSAGRWKKLEDTLFPPQAQDSTQYGNGVSQGAQNAATQWDTPTAPAKAAQGGSIFDIYG